MNKSVVKMYIYCAQIWITVKYQEVTNHFGDWFQNCLHTWLFLADIQDNNPHSKAEVYGFEVKDNNYAWSIFTPQGVYNFEHVGRAFEWCIVKNDGIDMNM